MSSGKFKYILGEITGLYNKLHGVESQAKVLEVRDDGTIVVEFTGTFCHTCGIRDWLEDYAYLALSKGYNLKLVEMIEPEGEEAEYKRIGVFKFNGLNTSSREEGVYDDSKTD